MISEISKESIRTGASAESYKRGVRYVTTGAVLSVRRRGTEILGRVKGSWDTPYRVKIRMAHGNIQHASCSCPYDWGGWCKHIVAVLLTCIDAPDEVEEAGDIESRLKNLTKEQLIGLVVRMVDQHDDLELLLEMATIQSGEAVDEKSIKSRIKRIFKEAGYEWGAAAQVASALEEFEKMGAGYCTAGLWEPAARFYCAFIKGIFEGYENIDDENGEVLMVLDGCVQSLSECLEITEEHTLRHEILSVLVEAFLWDVMMGGVGVGELLPEFVADQISDAEREVVVAELRQALPEGNPKDDDFSKGWNRKTIGEFLILLEGDLYDDETFLKHCRQTGNWIDLIDRLLALDRIEEAVAQSREVTGPDFIGVLEVFEERGQLDEIRDLVRARAKITKDEQLVETLKSILEEKGEIIEAQEWSELLFWRHKSLQRYDDLKRLALQAGTWEKRSEAVEARLKELEAFDLLTETYLRDGKHDKALSSLNNVIETAKGGWGSIPYYNLIMKVTSAIKNTCPEEAIRLHGYLAEQYIELRGRDNYSSAVRHLADVRRLYESLGRTADGLMVIDDMKAIHSNLRAFLEELNKAGL